MTMTGRCVLALVCAGGLAPPAATAGPVYRITDLGTLGGTYSRALGLDEQGRVVGEAAVADGSRRAFVWSAGVMTDLGTLGGVSSLAYAINASGQVVGTARDASGRSKPFLYTPGVGLAELPGLGGEDPGPNRVDGTAYAVTGAGVVVGHARNPAGQLQAFIHAGGVTTPIDPPGGTSNRAWDVNEANQVAGWGRDAGGALVGYRWSEAAGYELLGTLLDGADVFGVGVNDRGHVSGAVQKDFGHQPPGPGAYSRPFLWDPVGGIREYPLPAGFAGGAAILLNDDDWAVGDAFNFTPEGLPAGTVAALYTPDRAYDLNALIPAGSGWVLQRAYDISDRGQIVGWGTVGGQTRAFLLTPVPAPPSAVLAAAGVAALGAYRRLRRPAR
jgi:probable HAF family extracellular repeat protein